MSDLSKKITELLSNECKAAPDMTHGLKNIGDGDMKEGMKIMVDFYMRVHQLKYLVLRKQ